MFSELVELTTNTDARYASSSELQFLKDYLEEVDIRVNAYTKIRDNAEEIADKVAEEKRKLNPKFEDWYGICKRDFFDLLRYLAASMLFDDLERLRNGMLIWYKTIVRAYNYDQDSDETYLVVQEIIKGYLSPEEFKYILPVLQVNHIILAS